MSQKIVVGFDGSESGRAALTFAVEAARKNGGELLIAHVLEWSPYSFLTPTELEERHKRRGEELERAEKAILAPVVESVKASGVAVSTALRYGHIAETLISIAKEEGADQIVIGRTGHSSLSSRLFGSVAGSLAQAAPVAVTIVP
ncbi:MULTISPECIES: universal stress protein [Nioella]|jgi:nucleotide-binding universal stress UspA family protein|uniref:universal stress protein n=1 Tax=Nioella TaxID=1775424 RepID=UPI0008FD551E|nr:MULTISPECIES: universal stress protein [Nioella]TBX18686.1 universal stress protein [Roseovarius sp. JS7-11]